MTIDTTRCKELLADLERVQWKGGDIDKGDLERTHAVDRISPVQMVLVHHIVGNQRTGVDGIGGYLTPGDAVKNSRYR